MGWARAALPRGEWLKWCATGLGWRTGTVYRLLHVGQTFGGVPNAHDAILARVECQVRDDADGKSEGSGPDEEAVICEVLSSATGLPPGRVSRLSASPAPDLPPAGRRGRIEPPVARRSLRS